MCQCPMSVKREAKSIVSAMFSVCSGSPCNCDNESTCQVCTELHINNVWGEPETVGQVQYMYMYIHC